MEGAIDLDSIRREERYVKYLTVIEEIKTLQMKDVPIIIAIDGQCGSGKSTLATLLSEVLDCNVFHMDDYFLPFEMKTKERLAQAGGNVHYERFKEEILNSLQKNQPVTYRPYQCPEGILREPIYIEPKKIAIVEGSYSLHPTLINAYDYKIFLTQDPQMQKKRIRKRNGEEKLQQFINLWIPMENLYFTTYDIKSLCNIIIDTTDFWE